MGYTHYFTINEVLSAAQFERFVADAHEILRTAEIYKGIALADGMGKRPSEWRADNEGVIFNGYGEGAHEPFAVTPQSAGFGFCKTAYKPYDAAVTACLIALKEAYGDAVEISSDGEWSDWQQGAQLYREALGKTPASPLKVYA